MPTAPALLLLACFTWLCASLTHELQSSLKHLEDFNRDYVLRVSEGRQRGLSPQTVEFRRIQVLGKEGLLSEREQLQQHLRCVCRHSERVVIGIMADSGSRGLEVLRSWTEGLSLPRNKLYAVDDLDGRDLDVNSLSDLGVYIKYDSRKNDGDAYMKPYQGDFSGVIFQPSLGDNEFRQYGNFPSSVFS